MFELSSHRSSFNIENLKYTSGRLTTIHEFLKQRQKLLQRNRSYIAKSCGSNRTSSAEQNEMKAFYQIASLIPDEVLYNSENTKMRTFEAAVLFADVSGFTDLSDKYQNIENGASKLSMVLNFYLGIMVQEILSHNGDIIKYAGDAFIALFRHDKNMSMQNSVQNAIDTAIIIQNNCRDYLTEIGVVLNVKIAISCGEVDFSIIGDEITSHYVVIGDPVWQVKTLQELISPGEVLLTWKGWYYTQDSRYEHQAVREHRYYKITGFKEQLNIIREQYEANLNFQELQRNLNKNMESSSNSNIVVEPSLDAFTTNIINNPNELFSLRSINEQSLTTETKKSLRRFVIKPLLNAIDLNESIDSLIEMRNVVIVFVNVVPARNDSKNLIKITDKIYKKLSSIVFSYEGIQNKVSLFDKDMMFLNIFGLRGFQHENDSEIGLRCAYELHETLKNWSEVLKISIGVTTGKSYCGCTGHTLRREYSVISITTNRAARLMMAYPNIVSCDQETLIQSKMNLKHFTQLPKRALKGIRGDKPVYQFRDIVDYDKLSVSLQDYDEVFGRQEVMNLVHAAVSLSIDRFNNCENVNNIGTTKPCFVIKSESQEGKSTVINKLFRDYHETDLKCARLVLNTKHSSMQFWVIKYLLLKIFGNENYEEIVTQKLLKFNFADYYFLLNNILNTNFKQKQKLDKISNENTKALQRLLLTLLFKQSSNFWIFLIDDADFIDPMSMNFLNSIMESQVLYFIFTVGKQQKKWTLQQKQFYRDVTLHCLRPIDKTFHKDIACQSINVSAISIEFERFLQKNSNGNPGWIHTCAKTLLYSGKLKIKSLTIMAAMIDGMILKNDLMIHVTKKNNSNQKFSDIIDTTADVVRIKDANLSDELIDVAKVQSELTEKDYVVSFTNNKLMVYDSLSSQEQTVCKCASVLGQDFERAMLNYLLPQSNLRVIGRTIIKLFQLNIFYCASNKEKCDDTMWDIKNEVISCNCINLEILESCRDLPKYASCSHLTFNDERFRKYIYDTLTEKQLKEYHKKCIIYLYRNNKNCSQCGNQSFEIIDEIKVNYRDGFMKFDSNHDRIKKKMLKELKLRVCDFDKFDCKKRLKMYPLVLNYLSYDFRSCKCDKILSKLVTQIVEHCQGKDTIMKKIFSQITLANICLGNSNYPRAISLLEEASENLKNISGHAFKERALYYTYLRGRISLLNGICAEKIGHRENALSFYYEACEIFEIPFPLKFNFKAKLKLFKLVRDIKSTKAFCKSLSSTSTRIQAMIKQQGSILLQKLCEFYAREHNMKMAKLAALWSLKEALKRGNHTQNIARCFKNVIQIASSSSSSPLRIGPIVFNEVFRSLCYRSLNKETLEEICNLYISLMEYKICRNKIDIAIEIGQYAKRISYQMPSKTFLISLTPILFFALMKSRQIEECHKLLQEFSQCTKKTDGESLPTWYYALCMDLILDTGNDSVIEYDACWKHHLKKLAFKNYDSCYSEGYARFCANYWLWNLRRGNIDLSRLLMPSVLAYFKERASLCNIFTGIRIIDGLNFQLYNSIKMKNLNEFRNLIEVLKIFIARMRRITKNHAWFSDRLKLCEIHFHMISELKLKSGYIRRLKSLQKRALKRKDYYTASQVERLILNCKNHRVCVNH